jgi:hypothetical protein
MRLLYLVVLWVGLSGQTYTQIDYSIKPPEGWPELREEIVYGTEEQMQRWCQKFAEVGGGKVIGCAKAHFEWDLCMIFLSSDNPEHLEHERAHCRGYGHVGEGKIAHKAFELWKAKRK